MRQDLVGRNGYLNAIQLRACCYIEDRGQRGLVLPLAGHMPAFKRRQAYMTPHAAHVYICIYAQSTITLRYLAAPFRGVSITGSLLLMLLPAYHLIRYFPLASLAYVLSSVIGRQPHRVCSRLQGRASASTWPAQPLSSPAAQPPQQPPPSAWPPQVLHLSDHHMFQKHLASHGHHIGSY